MGVKGIICSKCNESLVTETITSKENNKVSRCNEKI